MQAEIITIGDEILIGQIVDTNSAWIAQQLNQAGIRVESKWSVADDRRAITQAVTRALQAADVVIVTGGLGPTKDDITKKTLAELFGCPLVEHRPTYELVERTLRERGIAFNGLNRAQALVPACCTVLMNPNGTAPGMWFEHEGPGRPSADGSGQRRSAVLVSLPGVPFEMKALMTDEVLPRLRDHFHLRAIVHRTMITLGLAESVLAETLSDWESALPPDLHLAYLPSPSQIRLRLSAYEVDGGRAQQQIDRQFAALERIIPAYVLGYDRATVVSATAELLTRRGKTLAVAESCTGGAISSRFTALPGASAYFLCGITSYSNESKTNLLGVHPDDLRKYGAVSRPVAEQMAAGARRLAGSDYALSTTGIAGPTGGTDEKPVGTVWIAVAHPGGVLSRKLLFGALREQNIERASSNAINLLRLLLMEAEEMPLTGGVL